MKLNHYANIFEHGHRPRPIFNLVSDRADIIPARFNEATLVFKEGVEVIELAELAKDILAFLADQTNFGHYQTLAHTAKTMYENLSKKDAIDSTARDITNVRQLNEPDSLGN